MPTVVTHALVGVVIAEALSAPLRSRARWLAAGAAMLPDLDVLAFAVGIPYESVWGHRGVSHSLLFALLAGALIGCLGMRGVVASVREQRLACAAVVLALLSHGLLDAATDGGLGVAFLAPFSDHRYFLPLRPIHVSPIGLDFFSLRGLATVVSEALWVWFPCAVLLTAIVYRHRTRP